MKNEKKQQDNIKYYDDTYEKTLNKESQEMLEKYGLARNTKNLGSKQAKNIPKVSEMLMGSRRSRRYIYSKDPRLREKII